MKTGRNDPCPCGSGKKYKKCCLAKDEAAKPAFEPAPGAPEEPPLVAAPAAFMPEPKAALPEEPPDPLAEQRHECWEEFEAADHPRRMALFTQVLAESWFDGDLAADMLLPLSDSASAHGQRDLFDGLLDLLQQQRPDLYDQDRVTYLSLRITNSLATGRSEALAQEVRELAAVGVKGPDQFHHTLSELAYHGQAERLLEARRIAWPQIRDSDELLPWAVESFAEEGMFVEMFNWIQQQPEGVLSDPQLLERLSFYRAVDPQEIGAVIERLRGHQVTPWSLPDFTLDPPGGRKRKPGNDENPADPRGVTNLVNLSYEFIAFARREGMSWTRANLGRQEIVHYLLARHGGQLQAGTLEDQPRLPPKAAENILCPEPATLETYFARLLGPLDAQPHVAVALLMVLPAWLRFLESRGLIDAAARSRVRQAIAPLATDFARLFENWTTHPVMVEDIKHWAERA